jgi:hypothetical protein
MQTERKRLLPTTLYRLKIGDFLKQSDILNAFVFIKERN